jgi:hypothetical protein
MVLLTKVSAVLRGFIGIYIPQIVSSLKDERGARKAAASTLLKLSEQGM